MTHLHRRILLALCLLASASLASAGDATDRRASEELRRICQELLDAVAPGKVEVWKKYLDDRLIAVDENGVVRGKEQLLKELTPLPPGLVGSAAVDDFKLELHGEVAAVTYAIQERLDYHGQLIHTRFRSSDTWLRTPEGWRLINQQVAAVLKDPPAARLTQPQLCAYRGTYVLTAQIKVTVQCSPTGLTMARTGRPPADYLPEVLDVFFAPGQPRTRRIFERNAQGEVVSFVDRREGEDIRWTRLPISR